MTVPPISAGFPTPIDGRPMAAVTVSTGIDCSVLTTGGCPTGIDSLPTDAGNVPMTIASLPTGIDCLVLTTEFRPTGIVSAVLTLESVPTTAASRPAGIKTGQKPLESGKTGQFPTKQPLFGEELPKLLDELNEVLTA